VRDSGERGYREIALGIKKYSGISACAPINPVVTAFAVKQIIGSRSCQCFARANSVLAKNER
jgi:hypothetical protein